MLLHGRLPPDFGGGPVRRQEDLAGAAALGLGLVTVIAELILR